MNLISHRCGFIVALILGAAPPIFRSIAATTLRASPTATHHSAERRAPADADLTGLPRHKMGQRAVKADRGEQQRQRSEKVRQRGDQPLRYQSAIKLGLPRFYLADGNIATDRK